MVSPASPPDDAILVTLTEAAKAGLLLPRESSMFAAFLGIRYVDPLGPEQTAVCLCRYENCEMRSVILSDTSGESGGLDPLFFPGGHSIKGPGKEPVQSHKGPAT